MTAESPKDSVDILASLVIDSESDTPEFNESEAGYRESMDEQGIRRFADLHLLHSLMLQVSSHDQTATE